MFVARVPDFCRLLLPPLGRTPEPQLLAFLSGAARIGSWVICLIIQDPLICVVGPGFFRRGSRLSMTLEGFCRAQPGTEQAIDL